VNELKAFKSVQICNLLITLSPMSTRIAIDTDEVLADTLFKHLAVYNLEHCDTLTKQDLEGKKDI